MKLAFYLIVLLGLTGCKFFNKSQSTENETKSVPSEQTQTDSFDIDLVADLDPNPNALDDTGCLLEKLAECQKFQGGTACFAASNCVAP